MSVAEASTVHFAGVGTRRTEKSGTGGAAGVEIAGFPQILFTRTFGDPDMLFVPLLDAAREAYNMIERLCSHGESHDSAVMLSGMQLASSMLRDPNFSLVARGLAHENSYLVDLDGGTLLVRARLFAVVSRRTSFFKVEIAGNLSGGMYVVRNAAHNGVIAQVEEERLRQPNFFSAILAQECLRTQIEQERFGHIEETKSAQVHQEIRLMVPAMGNKVPVILRQKQKDGPWDIVDGRQHECVGTLAPEVEGSLEILIRSVQGIFENK